MGGLVTASTVQGSAIPLAAPSRFFHGELRAVQEAVATVLDSGIYVGGPFLADFERRFADWLGPGLTAVGVGNGSDALVLAMTALRLPAGSLVAVPPNDGGFAATAAQSAGLVPLVMDVAPETGLVDIDSLNRVEEHSPRAVVLTHLHGQAAPALEVAHWCSDHAAALIEDCAQAHGARLADGRAVGTVGDLATFSFYPTKNLGAIGDGGAVVSRHQELSDRVRSLREYGWGPRFRVDLPDGRNSRLDPLQAAVLSARLDFLEAGNARRREVALEYRTRLPGLRFLGRDDDTFVAHHAVLVHPDRDRIQAELAEAGIASAVHYPFLVQDMPGIVVGSAEETPHARALAAQILSVPCFPGITDDEVDAVVEALRVIVRDTD